MERCEIVLSGFGGQGIVLGGIILAEAAAIYDDINATHNQSYGPEARGGASKSEVIISKEVIHFPEIEYPDVLVALTQEAANKFAPTVKEQGVLIVDSSVKINDQIKDKVKLYSLPITEMAVKVAGSEIVTNMVTLGALVAITKVVSREALEKAMFSRIPKGTEEVNMKALAQGFALAEHLV
ncbi:2-oxoacid:ferredoxin oxidoreductase subunit gamma [Thermanaerosceptrum fracticalcis]|jgi:2-oxoglutarate ferredoxin oxidoreductase subunit gamma|uniref:2-oxoacid:ferredoxin oxidoreductase subunit gamma n=1 Tax=Thermanaerosceptrum fracticalcis TaxID=1712410 RepID=A0A7G6DYP1_THEFR|nr:2-oxoacid:acceptor oxidoreductase family protein [Thermanaerosceptrum fracticalcis]QNB44945.1 2-oxoacid:ferredoxin oxidoreductase subunit gamma [Thermanaerosceptrum fracticalcis]